MRLFGTALIMLVLFCGRFTDPSDAIHLIHQVSEKYRGQRSVELSGYLSTAPPGAEFIVVEAVYAEADQSFVPKGSNLLKLGAARSFRRVKITDARGNDARSHFPLQGIVFPNRVA